MYSVTAKALRAAGFAAVQAVQASVAQVVSSREAMVLDGVTEASEASA